MKIGFIGVGNMGSAIIGGILSSGTAKNDDLAVSDKNSEFLDRIASSFSVKTSLSNIDTVKFADIVILCVKPNIIPLVLDEIKGEIKDNQIIVSIAAGVKISKIEDIIGKNKKVVRVMPNTPALVGEGMSAVCFNDNASGDKDVVLNLFNSCGKAECVTEDLMDIVTAVSGSSPAMVFMLIEAMADGAVQGGMTRASAYKFATQAVLGSAKMVLETGKHPGELKDMVCSPKGTTIDAVASLEEDGFRSAIMKSIRVCAEKSKKL